MATITQRTQPAMTLPNVGVQEEQGAVDRPPSTTFLPPHLVAALSNRDATVTRGLAADPSAKVSSIAHGLYSHLRPHPDGPPADREEKPSTVDKLLSKLHIRKRSDGDSEADARRDSRPAYEGTADGWQGPRMSPLTGPQLEEIVQFGPWSQHPSDLFLNIYAQALLAIDSDPLKGVVSPPLMASVGVVPLTIISTIPDIIHHHADLIVRAESEIILATNYWETSGAAKVLTDAMGELSRRVVDGKRPKVVVKLMYDRGNPKQVLEPHQGIEPKIYTASQVKLPAPEDIPGIDLQVQNYHEPPVGTFHAKYMIVDRKIALLCSNNIQDRVNVEMMVQYEGPIVQSFYDMALITWWETLEPSLPLISRVPLYQQPQAEGTLGQSVQLPNRPAGAVFTPNSPPRSPHTGQSPQKNAVNQDRTWDATDVSETRRVNATLTDPDALNQHLNSGTPIAATDTSTLENPPFTPVVALPRHDAVPMAMVNRPPCGHPGHGDTLVPQDQAWIAAFKFAQQSVFIQTPTFNAKPVVAAAIEAVKRGVVVEIYADWGFNDEGEMLPFQGGTNDMVAQHMYAQLEETEKDLLRIYWYTGKDQRTPINATEKSRNCHIKIMIVDGAVGIQGSGNQDTQSWFHSQEANVLLDSPLICTAWRAALDANQNTKLYGRVRVDGIWRDAEDNVLPGFKPPPNALIRPFVGVKGAIQRVRGEGGFAT